MMVSRPSTRSGCLGLPSRKTQCGNASVLLSLLFLATAVLSINNLIPTVNATDLTLPVGSTPWRHQSRRRRWHWRSRAAQLSLKVSLAKVDDDDNDEAVNNVEPITRSDSGSSSAVLSIRIQSVALAPPPFVAHSALQVRGGQDGDEEEDDDDDEGDDENDASSQGTDFAAVMEQVLDVTKTRVMPIVISASKKTVQILTKVSISTYHALKRAIQAGLEGGEEDDEDENDGDAADDAEVTLLNRALKIATKVVNTIQRMVQAALDFPAEEEASMEAEAETVQEDTLVAQTKKKVKNLKKEKDDDVVDDDDDNDADEGGSIGETIVTSDDKESADTSSSSADTTILSRTNDHSDLGAFLAKAYNVEDKRDKEDGPPILGGTLQDGLQRARAQARLLIVFIPAERPKGTGNIFPFFGGSSNKNDENKLDQVALESLLALEVGKAANKKSRKHGPSDLGSFAIWGAKAGSSEAAAALKRLKVKSTSAKGEKRPVLCVVYPAYVSALDTAGLPKIVPKVLAEHHCNPPPDASSMVSWMNALRKRHANEFKKMHAERIELELLMERQKGYKESVQTDKERKRKEAQEAADQKAKEEAEAAHKATIDKRRKELQSSLPEDQKESQVRKIALRFADGKKGQRSFSPDTPLSVVFNWVDAMFGMERETVILTTLNGKQTFSWDEDGTNDMTLEEAELGKMTAFRVTEKKEEESAAIGTFSS